MKRHHKYLKSRWQTGDRLDRMYVACCYLVGPLSLGLVLYGDLRAMLAGMLTVASIGAGWNFRELRRFRRLHQNLEDFGPEVALASLPPAEQEEIKMSIARLKLSNEPSQWD